MNVERYSDLTKTILQAAQADALGSSHARLETVHILRAMVLDTGGLARLLIVSAGGDADLLATRVHAASQSVMMTPQLAKSSAPGARCALSSCASKILSYADSARPHGPRVRFG